MRYNENYIPELEDDNEKIPDIKQNEVSEKFAIGILIGVAVWILTFFILKSLGVISPLVMRICIYPVILIIIIAYVIVKNNNNKL